MRVGAGVLEHALRLLGRVDVAVGDHRDAHGGLHRADGVVLGLARVAAGARAAVHRERPDAARPRRCARCAARCGSRVSQPVRILSVTGTSTARTTASRMRATSGSSCSSAEPAATLQTFLAGQPMLMSMICAPSVDVVARGLGHHRRIGAGDLHRHRLDLALVVGAAHASSREPHSSELDATISDTAMPAPMRLHSCGTAGR